MSAMASQITNLTIVYSIVYSGADQRKHQNSSSLAFVREIHRWPVNSPHKRPVTRKMFLMTSSCSWIHVAHLHMPFRVFSQEQSYPNYEDKTALNRNTTGQNRAQIVCINPGMYYTSTTVTIFDMIWIVFFFHVHARHSLGCTMLISISWQSSFKCRSRIPALTPRGDRLSAGTVIT